VVCGDADEHDAVEAVVGDDASGDEDGDASGGAAFVIAEGIGGDWGDGGASGEGGGEDLADDDGVGEFERIEFGTDGGAVLGDIEDLGETDELADVVSGFGDEDACGAGDRGETAVGVEAEVAPERGGGFGRVEVLEFEEEGGERVALGERVRGFVDGETFGEIGLGSGGETDADGETVGGGGEDVAVEDEAGLDEFDGFRFGDWFGGDEADGFTVEDGGFADDGFAGEEFVDAEDVADSVVRELELDALGSVGGKGR
jgi:hypothetical protein